MLSLPQSLVEELMFDPVMAAEVLMGAKLDTFQKCRLRFLWFVPECIDSSGVGSGKTQVSFIYLNLRCILMPGHWAAIYFPNFQIGKDTFWSKFAECMESSPIFAAQFHSGSRTQDEDKANAKNPGAWIRSYKNGAKLFMPAPDFKGDSKNQASRDFNTVVIDDYLRAADQGDGIDRQLVDRARRACFNKNHPVWCNHLKFFGHAESPTHKEFKRYSSYLKAIQREGSSRNACFTFCYRDWTPAFARKHREDNLIRSQKRKLSPDRFRRQYEGIWTLDGENFYPEAALRLCRRAALRPQTERRQEDEHFFLGQDTAQPNASRKADFSAWVVLRSLELPGTEGANYERNGRHFHLSVAYAHKRRQRDAPWLAAFTHRLNLKFLFEGIALDPGGGGLFVLPELRKAKQVIGNVERTVTGLTTKDDALQITRIPIVRVFKRGAEFDKLVPPWYLRGDEGFLEYWHEQTREAVHARGILFPALAADRPPGVVESWPKERQLAQMAIEECGSQLAQVRQLKSADGSKLVNRRGYALFEVAKGKKDLAYAFIYAYARFLLWLDESQYDILLEPGSCFGAFAH